MIETTTISVTATYTEAIIEYLSIIADETLGKTCLTAIISEGIRAKSLVTIMFQGINWNNRIAVEYAIEIDYVEHSKQIYATPVSSPNWNIVNTYVEVFHKKCKQYGYIPDWSISLRHNDVYSAMISNTHGLVDSTKQYEAGVQQIRVRIDDNFTDLTHSLKF